MRLTMIQKGRQRPAIRLVVAALLCALLTTETASAQTPNALDALSSAMEEMTSKVAPTVVQIQVTRYTAQDGGGYGTNAAVLGKQQGIGSGVIVHPDGYIITNAHVVSGAQRIRVSMSPVLSDDAESRPDNVITASLAQATVEPKEATLVGMLEEFDIALIKVNGENFPILEFASYRALRQGQLVFAFGSRDGLEHSVSMGVVSSVARQPDPDSPFLFIQTDAAINPGDSGGPLVNAAGQIVGINTFILSQSGGSEGLGFAIPSPLIKLVADQLRQYGHLHRPVIGIGVQALTPVLAAALNIPRRSGIIISDVSADSPAERAGLRLNDVILALGDTPIYNVPMFAMNMLLHPADKPLALQILRSGRRLDFQVTPSPADGHGSDRLADFVDPQTGKIPRLGIVGVKVDDRVAKLLPPLRNAYGVYVAARADVVSGATSGLRIGDVIHEINGSIVSSVESINEALESLRPGDPVALLIERDGALQYEAFEVE